MDHGKHVVTIEATINAPLSKIWELYTLPEHIVQWNQASPDWQTTTAENDLQVGGLFSFRMEAKDGSFGFDFGGTYTKVDFEKHIGYTLGDDRKVTVDFATVEDRVQVLMTFEAEEENDVELQREGWQAILNSFKAYAELDLTALLNETFE